MQKLHLTKTDRALIAAITVFLLLVTTAGWWLVGEIALSVTLILAAVVVMASTLEVYRRLSENQFALGARAIAIVNNQRRYYEQVEALLSLYFTIDPAYPLPKTTVFAASPDFLRQTYDLIQQETPNLVVEAGSGTSTLITAYGLRRIGRGKVISLEHDPKYADITRGLISQHGLQDISTVVLAPLKEYQINGHSWLWYDLTSLAIDRPINLLLVDGPPASTQRLARYPALPLLFGQLSEEATIIVDDGIRMDEKTIVDLWAKEYGHLSCEFVPLEKGCYVMHRTRPKAGPDPANLSGPPR